MLDGYTLLFRMGFPKFDTILTIIIAANGKAVLTRRGRMIFSCQQVVFMMGSTEEEIFWGVVLWVHNIKCTRQRKKLPLKLSTVGWSHYILLVLENIFLFLFCFSPLIAFTAFLYIYYI